MSLSMLELRTEVKIQLPDWFNECDMELVFEPHSASQAMDIAIALAASNVSHQTGGPFGALVVSLARGQVISAAVNCVEAQQCSAAHAEIVALSLAQQALHSWNLAETAYGPLTLVTTCEPCAMCFGAVPWSGVKQVICGASKADAEAAGFDEGPRHPDWIGAYQQRGIEVITGVGQAAAAQVLMDYAHSGQTIYNP